jgi:hypothetical protein
VFLSWGCILKNQENSLINYYGLPLPLRQLKGGTYMTEEKKCRKCKVCGKEINRQDENSDDICWDCWDD